MFDRVPHPDPDVEPLAPFWAAAAEDRLVLPFNDDLGRHVWYPGGYSPYGEAAREYRWVEVSGRGRLFSWVHVTHAFLPHYRELVPFVTGLVAIDEDPDVRLPTFVVDADPGELVCDLPVEVTFRDVSYHGVAGTTRVPAFTPTRSNAV